MCICYIWIGSKMFYVMIQAWIHMHCKSVTITGFSLLKPLEREYL